MKKFLLAIIAIGTQFAASAYAAECDPIFAPREAQPVFVAPTAYQIAYNTVLQGGTATVTLNGITYDCWNESGNPVMRARNGLQLGFSIGGGNGIQAGVCVGGNCGGTPAVSTSRTGFFRR